MQLKSFEPGFSVTSQVQEEQIPELARRGFKSIIGNRPEGEAPDQPQWSALAAAAARNGLQARQIPVTARAIEQADVDAFREALRDMPKPIAAFCRTGTRAALLWALASEGTSTVGERVEIAAEHGFDLEPFRSQLQAS